MIITTTNDIPGKEIQILGIVKGNTIRARWFGRDIAAGFKNLVGGEIVSYTDMVSKTREEAQHRMIEEAKKLGADAIVAVRFSATEVMPSTAEILAYGTAVKIKK